MLTVSSVSYLFNFRGWWSLDGMSWGQYGTREHPQRGNIYLKTS